MSGLFDTFSATGFELVNLAGLPILIWTILAGAILLFLHRVDTKLHTGIHHHLHLALLIANHWGSAFSLPAGILLTYVEELAAGRLISGYGQQAVAVQWLVIPSPLEVSIAEPQTSEWPARVELNTLVFFRLIKCIQNSSIP